MSAAWRAEDEALLRRLEDASLLAIVWRALAAPDAALPHARAAGVFARLRTRVDGALAIERALRGDPNALVRAVRDPAVADLEPRLAHHLALLHGELADRWANSNETTARHHRLRALAMWLWLAQERDYLRTLAEVVSAGGLPPAEVVRVADEAPFAVLLELGRRARAGAREITDPARLALEDLARVGDACAIAAIDEPVRQRASRIAQRERSAAIDDAIGRLDDALEDATMRSAAIDELAALFTDAAAVWRWSGGDEHVERFIVQRITPIAWERYRERKWDELRALLRPIEEPIEHLAKRVSGDPTQLAYAAPCAQIFVFRAEIAKTLDDQFALAERAVALCPTHRNGRLVLADLLCERAMRTVDGSLPWNTGDKLAKAATDVKRAEELFPALKRLADTKQRLRAMGRDVDA